jgi:hypothetical protein
MLMRKKVLSPMSLLPELLGELDIHHKRPTCHMITHPKSLRYLALGFRLRRCQYGGTQEKGYLTRLTNSAAS